MHLHVIPRFANEPDALPDGTSVSLRLVGGTATNVEAHDALLRALQDRLR